MSKKKAKVRISEYPPEYQWMNLPSPIWEGSDEASTGITREAVYIGKRSKRVVVEYYSIWENRLTHGCEGTYYVLIDDPAELTELADEYPEIAAELETSGILTPKDNLITNEKNNPTIIT